MAETWKSSQSTTPDRGGSRKIENMADFNFAPISAVGGKKVALIRTSARHGRAVLRIFFRRAQAGPENMISAAALVLVL